MFSYLGDSWIPVWILTGVSGNSVCRLEYSVPGTGLEKIPISQWLVTLLHICETVELYQHHNHRKPCFDIARNSTWAPTLPSAPALSPIAAAATAWGDCTSGITIMPQVSVIMMHWLTITLQGLVMTPQGSAITAHGSAISPWKWSHAKIHLPLEFVF